MSDWPDLAGRIDGQVHRLPIRVYYEDTDFSGIVYHANYLRFAERGRSDFLRLAGVHHADLFEGADPLAFAVHRMEIDFLKPGARIEAEQTILRLADGADEEPIWRARVFAACLDAAGRPRRLPAGVRQALAPFVGPETGSTRS